MNFIKFKEIYSKQQIFSINEVLTRIPDFNRNNLTRWIKQGYIIKLRNGWYSLSDATKEPDFAYYVARRIYAPSYISLETALCIYDIIPEAVFDVVSVSTRKTKTFSNDMGNYYYYTIKPTMMFGYKAVKMFSGLSYYIAEPEKAIIDFLYLHPEYNSTEELENLRFDEVFMTEELDLGRLKAYLARIDSPTLTKRILTLLQIYNL